MLSGLEEWIPIYITVSSTDSACEVGSKVNVISSIKCKMKNIIILFYDIWYLSLRKNHKSNERFLGFSAFSYHTTFFFFIIAGFQVRVVQYNHKKYQKKIHNIHHKDIFFFFVFSFSIAKVKPFKCNKVYSF